MDGDSSPQIGMSDPGQRHAAGPGGPALQKLPEDAQGLELFIDRDNALKIFAKFQEISRSQTAADMFKATFDPSKHGALAQFQNTRDSIDKATLEELGLASAISDWDKFPGILKILYYKWRFDPAVMMVMSQYVVIIRRFGVPLQLGSTMEDVKLVTMANEEACVLGGTLHDLFTEFQDRVDFLCVYLAEAHPRERWNFGQEFNAMQQHATIQDRLQVARELMAIDAQHHQTFTDDAASQTKLRLVLDAMDNNFALAYDAFPDRVIVVEGGKVTFIGRDIETQLNDANVLMTDEARAWLQQRFGSN